MGHEYRDMSKPKQVIDRDKLRAKLRRMNNAQVYELLDRAIDLLPRTKLISLVHNYISLKDLKPDSDTDGDLLEAVENFQRRSLNGEYYQSFMVNSKNCTEISQRTCAWMADCNRLLDNCRKAASKMASKQTAEAFDIIFDLLAKIDSEPDVIVFFADEGGSWQVGCDWKNILSAWFKCLSVAATPDDYAQKVVSVVDGFVHYDRDRFLASARRAGTTDQRRALGVTK